MWVRRGVLCGLIVFAGCGDDADRPRRPEAPPQEAPEPETSIEPPPPEPGLSDRDFLRGLEAALSHRVATAKEAQTELLGRHREELQALGDFASTHARERQQTAKLRRAEGQIRFYEKKLAEADPDLERVAQELTKLHGEDEVLTEQLEEARSAFLQRRRGRELTDSPVAADLKRIRGIQHRWFDLTVDLRGRRVYGTQKKKLNVAFRGWLAEDPERGRVAAEALAKNPARRKPGPEAYDLTDLTFFVLCQELEDDLDRRNVSVELDHLAIQRAKEEKLVAKIEALDVKITTLENSPKASELREVQDFRDSLGTHHHRRDLALRNIEEAREELRPKREMQVRQEKELEAAEAALTEARAKLSDAKAKLESLDG